MPLIEKFQCDNPKCDSEALPEDGGTKKRPASRSGGTPAPGARTPYGWLRAVVQRQGSWTYTCTVCSIPCLQPAVEDANRYAREHDR
jgi:hypothetical protein